MTQPLLAPMHLSLEGEDHDLSAEKFWKTFMVMPGDNTVFVRQDGAHGSKLNQANLGDAGKKQEQRMSKEVQRTREESPKIFWYPPGQFSDQHSEEGHQHTTKETTACWEEMGDWHSLSKPKWFPPGRRRPKSIPRRHSTGGIRSRGYLGMRQDPSKKQKSKRRGGRSWPSSVASATRRIEEEVPRTQRNHDRPRIDMPPRHHHNETAGILRQIKWLLSMLEQEVAPRRRRRGRRRRGRLHPVGGSKVVATAPNKDSEKTRSKTTCSCSIVTWVVAALLANLENEKVGS